MFPFLHGVTCRLMLIICVGLIIAAPLLILVPDPRRLNVLSYSVIIIYLWTYRTKSHICVYIYWSWINLTTGGLLIELTGGHAVQNLGQCSFIILSLNINKTVRRLQNVPHHLSADLCHI